MFCTMEISMYFYRIKCRMKTTLIRVIILFAGLIIAHFGVSVVIKSDAGTGCRSRYGNLPLPGRSCRRFLPAEERKIINKIIS